MLFTAGLIFIVAGLAVQFTRILLTKNRELSPFFLVLYGIGCALLVTGNILSKDAVTGILNGFCVVLVVAILVKLPTARK